MEALLVGMTLPACVSSLGMGSKAIMLAGAASQGSVLQRFATTRIAAALSTQLITHRPAAIKAGARREQR
jgi:hypothetical protein